MALCSKTGTGQKPPGQKPPIINEHNNERNVENICF